MRLALAQIDPVVGAFEANFQKIKEAYERACLAQARLLLTPELGVCGYPPHDLVERPEMFDRCDATLARLAGLTKGKSTALVVGSVARNPSETGRAAQNVVSVLENGKEVFRQAKTLLPTYDVFDEARYFEPATEQKVWDSGEGSVAFAICEDLWGDDPHLGRHLYGVNPVDSYPAQKPRLLVSISASPYEWGKRERREKLHGATARKLGVPLVYVNQYGATDEILFDGASFGVSADGQMVSRLAAFQPGFALLDVDLASGRVSAAANGTSEGPFENTPPSELEVLHRALVAGIREYFARSHMKLGILGLSGGIDSAVVAALAVEALGPKNVLGIAMPSKFSSPHSLEDAEALAKNLGIPFEVRPIKFLNSTSLSELTQHRGELAPLAQENLQSRLRGLILMTLSNHYGALVLTTGNKSELATGYCTLYGDMCGALAPIGDVYKTRVYELAQEINRTRGGVIPTRSITKAPSAELKPDQRDQDTLPPYDQLDALLEAYVERAVPVAELEKQHGKWVRETLRRLELNEFKRRQAAPVLKVSRKAFGIGRRIPLSKVWEQ